MRVMRILTRPNLGGPTRQAVALWHAHAAQGLRTLLVTGAVDSAETALCPADAGVPPVDRAQVLAGEPVAGWLALPELQRRPHLLRDRQARGALRRLIETFAPDVVHTHTSKAGWLGRRAAQDVGHGRVAHTFHGHVLRDYFGPLRSWLLARLERRLATRTDLLFAVSASCADELTAAGVAPRGRIAVVPPAVPLPEFAPRDAARRELGLPADAQCLASIGRLVPIKRIEHFLAMLRLLPDVHGVVFGDGPLRTNLETAGRDLGGRLHWCGARADAVRLLPAFDALVLPSRREGLPLVAVEAAAAGLPVVGYAVPGVQDALGGGAGTLVAEHDGPAGLARAVAECLATPAAAPRRLAAAARLVAASAPDRVATLLREAYGGHRPRAP
jgi:glycosyltransferase involved in cell wall biosynthesis